MRITLVEENAGRYDFRTYIRANRYEPIGIEYIGALLQQKGYEVTVFARRDPDQERSFRTIMQSKPNIVGFSVMTFNYPHSLELANRIKAYDSRIHTVFGGYHPSAVPDVVREPSIDFVVIGEGEYTFLDLVRALEEGGDLAEVKGIAYFHDGEVRRTPPRQRTTNLDCLPLPLRNKEILKDCAIQLAYPPVRDQQGVAQVTCSRGCPYNCAYCVSPKLWGKRVIYRSPQHVVEELKHLQREYDTNIVFFTDLTFNLNKSKVFELCAEIKRERVQINWFCMCQPIPDPELYEAMHDAGCVKIGWGVESLNSDSLRRINRDPSLDKIRETMSITESLGIINRAYIMMGYPWEDREYFDHFVSYLCELPIDHLRIVFLTPFPSTPIYDEYIKNGSNMYTTDLSKFDSEEPIIKVPGFTSEELLNLRSEFIRTFYERSEKRLRAKARRFPHLKPSYDEFFDFLTEQSVLMR